MIQDKSNKNKSNSFLDKEAHSSAGLGAIFAALYCIFVDIAGINHWMYLLAPTVLATSKECFDCLRGKSLKYFSWSDWIVTHNPLIILKWYTRAIKQ